MRARDRRIAILIAFPGTLFCVWAVYGFFRTIVDNQLPWADGATAPEHYLAVGRSFSLGFAAGFFLCFFLAITAIAISAWVRSRRYHHKHGSSPKYARRQEDQASPEHVEATGEASPVPATLRR